MMKRNAHGCCFWSTNLGPSDYIAKTRMARPSDIHTSDKNPSKEKREQIWLYLGSPAAWKSWDTLSCSQTTTGGSTASQLIKKTR